MLHIFNHAPICTAQSQVPDPTPEIFIPLKKRYCKNEEFL
jgi:hypothetical protein